MIYKGRIKKMNVFFIFELLIRNVKESVQPHTEKLLFLAAQSLTTDALEDDSNVQERIINICRRAKEVKLMKRRYENSSTFIPVIYSYNNLSRTKTYGKW